MSYDNYAGQVAVSEKMTSLNGPRRMTLRERLLENQKGLQEALLNVTSAIEFLDKNPDFESFHNIIGKAGF